MLFGYLFLSVRGGVEAWQKRKWN